MENDEHTANTKALAAMLLQRAQAHAPEGVKARVYGAVTDGEKSSSYRGAIVHIEDGIAIQKLNDKGSFAVHEAEGLAVGDVVNIGYYKDVRSVAPHVPGEKVERPARAARAPKDPTLESNAPKETRKRPEGEPEATKGKKGVASRKTTEPKKSVADIDGEIRQRVAERIVKSIEEGTSIWQKPWDPAAKKNRPHNELTGANYQGMNRVLLMTEMLARGSNDTRFMTYRQCQTLAAEMAKNGTPEDKLPQVRKGSESIEIVKFGRAIRKEAVLDDAGQPKRDADGKAIVKEKYGRSYLQTFNVFHASDIENMPPLEMADPKAQWEVHAEAERLLELSGVPIDHNSDNRAYYMPSMDRISIPEMVQYKDASSYYSVALHEVAHSTGHASRLNREGIAEFGGFGSASYSYEELIAETASAFTASEVGLDNDAVMNNHASYLAGWASKIKEDPKALFKAFNEAEQASDFIMQRHPIQLEAQAQLAKERGMDLGLQQGLVVPDFAEDYTDAFAPEQTPTQQSAGMSM